MTEKLLTMPVVDLLKFGVAPEIVLRLTMVESELESHQKLSVKKSEDLLAALKELEFSKNHVLDLENRYLYLENDLNFDQGTLYARYVIEQFEEKIVRAFCETDPQFVKPPRRELWSGFLQERGLKTHEILASALTSCGNEFGEREGSSISIISRNIVKMHKAFSARLHSRPRVMSRGFVQYHIVNVSDLQVLILKLIASKGLKISEFTFRKAEPGSVMLEEKLE